MVRRKECIGLTLIGLGVGFILSAFFDSLLITLLLGLGLIGGGCIFAKCCG